MPWFKKSLFIYNSAQVTLSAQNFLELLHTMQRKITVAVNVCPFSWDQLHTLLHQVLSLDIQNGCRFLWDECLKE
jgi:hypothetical protein